jgi:hypothetical protein
MIDELVMLFSLDQVKWQSDVVNHIWEKKNGVGFVVFDASPSPHRAEP